MRCLAVVFREPVSERSEDGRVVASGCSAELEVSMRYRLEQRIETLAHNAIMKEGRMEAAFSVGPIRYAHWDFEQRQAWSSDYWLAEATIDADDYKCAFRIFRQELNRVVPRIALIGQAYTDCLYQPMLIVKEGEQVGFLRYVRRASKVGLMDPFINTWRKFRSKHRC